MYIDMYICIYTYTHVSGPKVRISKLRLKPCAS